MKNKKPKVKNINCEEATKRFNTFLDNYLKGNAREELLHHIESCSHCFDRLEFEQLLKRKINEISKTASAEEMKAKKNMEKVLSKLPALNSLIL